MTHFLLTKDDNGRTTALNVKLLMDSDWAILKRLLKDKVLPIDHIFKLHISVSANYSTYFIHQQWQTVTKHAPILVFKRYNTPGVENTYVRSKIHSKEYVTLLEGSKLKKAYSLLDFPLLVESITNAFKI